MNRQLLFMVSLALVGCTITVTPIKKKPIKKYVKHSHKSKVAAKPSNFLIVDSDWLTQYRQLEEAHGDYRLSDDTRIESVGGGKYKVTHAMMDHFTDLSRTPVASPTPR